MLAASSNGGLGDNRRQGRSHIGTKGNLAIVGRSFAVADLHSFLFSGLAAWFLWLGVHIYFLLSPDTWSAF
jgi:NADH dehydrogenase FAD-containing subunit